MAYISHLLFDFAPYVHYISFILLMLAGFNFPISEDMIFIISASIAATIIPEHTFKIAAGCVLGAYLSDIVSYCLGRFGMKFILQHKKLARFYPMDKIQKIEHYYQSHGAKTLFFGRFIPFGVRNVIFLTAGLARMKLYKFMLVDLLALSITSTTLFTIGYTLGSNYEIIYPYLNRYKLIIFSLFLLTVLSIVIYKKRRQ
ncbi:MAG: DedA family protein [Spirochaetota bacterium]